MKHYYLVIIIALMVGCGSDDLGDTSRVITTDKSQYNIGEAFLLTLTILPDDDGREIRLYKNFKNLEVSFALVDTTRGMWNDDWSRHSGTFLDKSEVVAYYITQTNPFTKTFSGRIVERSDSIVLSIPELKMYTSFDKRKIAAGAQVRIHCFHHPIDPAFGSPMEDYFEAKDITIKSDR